MTNKLSVIIPTNNEEQFLTTCLKSVSFADEVIVLDSGSTDKTLEIATRHGAKVIKYQWQGFRYAHEFGAKQASGKWLLYVDADERVSRQLKSEILNVLEDDAFQAYQMPRRNFIMGEKLSYGGWYPDYVTRLIKKNALSRWVGELHEYPEIEGKIGQLQGELYHLTHRGLDWMLLKTQKYTKIQAQILFEHNHPPVRVRNFFGATGREFWYRAISKNGWKDGFVGWLEILYQTFNAFLIQVYVWELQQKRSMIEKYKQIDKRINSEL